MTSTTAQIVLVVEFSKDMQPWNALTLLKEVRHDGKAYQHLCDINIDYCKRNDMHYYHNAGTGGFPSAVDIKRYKRPVWIMPQLDAVYLHELDDKFMKQLLRLRRCKSVQHLLLPELPGNVGADVFLDDMCEGETIYCDTCKDDYPTDSEWDLCEHVWWCEDCGWWTTPTDRVGKNSNCNHKRKADE